jgi:hypothetical protein
MSSPTVSPPQDQAQPTRRQLDELDALLQRMLELPVHRAENEQEPPASKARDSDFVEQAKEIHQPWEDIQPARNSFPEEVFHDKFEPYPRSSEEDTKPLEIDVPSPTANLETARPIYFTETANESNISEKLPPKSPPPADEVRNAWGYHTLLWIDDLYVSLTGTWGGLGFWLRGPAGRTLLGGIGLMALAVTLALTIRDRINWPQ